jgi:hypothetical protein
MTFVEGVNFSDRHNGATGKRCLSYISNERQHPKMALRHLDERHFRRIFLNICKKILSQPLPLLNNKIHKECMLSQKYNTIHNCYAFSKTYALWHFGRGMLPSVFFVKCHFCQVSLCHFRPGISAGVISAKNHYAMCRFSSMILPLVILPVLQFCQVIFLTCHFDSSHFA